MKASLDLIKKLRAQLPPEASAALDDLEGLAAGDEGADDTMPNMSPEGEDEPMLEDAGHEDDGGMEGLRDTLDMEDEEGTDEPVDVNGSARAKKKAPKKPSFWG